MSYGNKVLSGFPNGDANRSVFPTRPTSDKNTVTLAVPRGNKNRAPVYENVPDPARERPSGKRERMKRVRLDYVVRRLRVVVTIKLIIWARYARRVRTAETVR